jgi:hypothetical protein
VTCISSSCHCPLLLLPASMEQVDSIAAWVAKYGSLLA